MAGEVTFGIAIFGILSSLFLTVAVWAAEDAGVECFGKMTADKDCGVDIAKTGYKLESPSVCLLTSAKLVCDFTKQEFCASQILGSGDIIKNAVPVCRSLPDSCKKACSSNTTTTAAASQSTTKGVTTPAASTTKAPLSTFAAASNKTTFTPTVPFTGIRADRCVDQSPLCPFWKFKGECSKNPYYMNVNCAGSCGCEFGTSLMVVEDCKNSNGQCLFWAERGECVKNRNYMYWACPAACGICDPKVHMQYPLRVDYDDVISQNTGAGFQPIGASLSQGTGPGK